jgi:UDP-glucose 4-epimerase
MNVYITGLAGFLGSHLADRLLDEGHFVDGCDSLIGGDFDNVPFGKRAWLTEAACEAIDAYDLRHTDVLYHCAALAHEGLSVFSPALISQNIYGASAAVFSAAIQAGVKRIVFCSSMARYGFQAQRPPFLEAGDCYPVDPYGVSKLAAERLLAVLAEAHGFEYVIAVPHNIIGPRQKYDDPYRNVASIMVNRMLQGQPPIIYGDGNQKRCFSFVQDCVESLARMATYPVSAEVINIGPDEGMITINELARILMDLTGFKGDPVYMPGRPQEVKEAWCSSDKARRLLGFDAKTPLVDGLRSIVEHIRERGPKPFNYHLPVEIVKGAPKTWTERII